MSKQINDASQSQKGFLYQYVQTLWCCFQMCEGESVYIEMFGDISTNETQIEVKHYSDELTDLHENFWKTIRNWMDDSFKLSEYSHLLLLTTQKISDNGRLVNWNEKNHKERQEILRAIQASFNRQNKKSQETQKLLDFVLDPQKNNKLEYVLKHMNIVAEQPGIENLWKKLKDVHAKSIPDSSKDSFMQSLLGYLFNPSVYSENKISYADFSNMVQTITQDYIPRKKFFPKAECNISSEDRAKQEDRPYITKIKEIEYHDVVKKAITDYHRTLTNLINDFSNRIVLREALQEYESEIESSFCKQRRYHIRNLDKQDVIKASQNFYDEMIDPQSVIPFYDYDDTPKYFSNGMLHGIIDEKDNMRWILNTGEDDESND